ncbi:rhodanese-like domain-containing protein [Desulfoluna sp.]|uniref:rhodanese-like domain-containing protein n=1 Tax=Desulfoluna sp. TaxID=2045199 RepID=UPI0026320DF8|nr:rhodanese-like domain-containing protein [Desulfoluna sp.]
MKQLWPEELGRFLKRHGEGEYTLVDVRGEEEYEAEHMPGSICIPALELGARAGELDPSLKTVFICARGAKSLATALIFEEKVHPEGDVYNLMGGLDAWMGRLAYGLPRIRLVSIHDDLPRMLVTAMDLEKGAWRFYQRLEMLMAGAGPEALVRRLAAVEISHLNLLHTRLKRIDPQAPDNMALFNSLPGVLAEGGESVSLLFQRLENGDLGWESLFEVALEIEMAAYEMYRSLAAGMDGEGRGTFYALAEAEKGHIRMLLTEMDAEAGSVL